MFISRQLTVLLMMGIVASQMAFAESIPNRIALPSPGFQLVDQATLIGPTNPDDKITFMVWLQFRNKAQMDQLAHDIYDPHHSRYHQFMTKEEYQTLFSPTPETKQIVQHYFISQGMNAEIVYNAIRVEGTVKQVEQLLNVKINNYRYKERTYYSNKIEPSIAASIAQYVQSITGLTSIPRFHGSYTKNSAPYPRQAEPAQVLKFNQKSFMPLATPTATSLQGFNARTLQTTYRVASIAPIKGTVINGAGQTIVITDNAGIYGPEQIVADANSYGASVLPVLTANNFVAIDQNGNTCTTQCTAPNDPAEIALDVESSHTLAPGAHLVLVLDTTGFEGGLITAINILINNNYTIAGFSNAYQISNSWDGPEDPNDPLEPYLQLAAMSGIGVNFSSGDCGDGTQPTANGKCAGAPHPSVAYPATSIYATAVGASALFVDTNWNYAFEQGWGDYDGDSTTFNGGTTGGISQYFGPTSWQSGINNFFAVGYNNGTVGSYNKRAVPDIGMLGSPATGLVIVLGGQSEIAGGTSLACPLFTAVEALANQARALTAGGQNPIGQAAPVLYNNHTALVNNGALNLVIPPHQVIAGATPPRPAQIAAGAPASAFVIFYEGYFGTLGWDTSLGILENQYWNDEVGLGTINIPNFVALMAGL